MKRFAKSILKLLKNESNVIKHRINIYRYEKREKTILKNLGLSTKKAPREDEYQAYWYPIVKRKTPWAFRLYGSFNNYDIRVLSQNATNIINDILNPLPYRGYLRDKNNFDLYLGSKYFPATIFRRINGGGYSFDYKPLTIKECITILDAMPIGTRIIIKPTVNSDSGRGVELYEKDNSSKFFHLRGDKLILLDSERLDSIGRNIIIQEAMIQSDYISQFNASSINTIRIATYRSVCDENIHILSSVIRIGKAGSIVDNGHSGGKMVRILDDGTLDKYCSDQYGNHKTSHNGIDFCKNVYRIPQWENVLKFAKEVSSKILHARLVQLDIMLDSNNTPHLIEFNITGFSMWQAQFTGTPAFGNLTDEVREYTIANLK